MSKGETVTSLEHGPAVESGADSGLEVAAETISVAEEISDIREDLTGLDSELISPEIIEYAERVGVDPDDLPSIASSEGLEDSWGGIRSRANKLVSKVRILLGGVALTAGILQSPQAVEAQAISQKPAQQEVVVVTPDQGLEELAIELDGLYEEAKSSPEGWEKYKEKVASLYEENRTKIIDGMMDPDEAVRMQSARMRKTINDNIVRLREINKSGESVVYLGNGEFVITDPAQFEMFRHLFEVEAEVDGKKPDDDFINLLTSGEGGGFTFINKNLERYLNVMNQRGLHEKDTQLFDLLAENDIEVPTHDERIILEPGTVIFTSPQAFSHEVLHTYMIEDERLVKYWVNVWNSQSELFRTNFLNRFDYLEMTEEEKKRVVEQGIDANEVLTIAKDMKEGKKAESKEYELIQEFFAYSSDNTDDIASTLTGYEIKKDGDGFNK